MRENSARAALAEEETRLVARGRPGSAAAIHRDRHRRNTGPVGALRVLLCVLCPACISESPGPCTAGRPPAGGAARGNQPRSMMSVAVARHVAATRRPRDPLKRGACQRGGSVGVGRGNRVGARKKRGFQRGFGSAAWGRGPRGSRGFSAGKGRGDARMGSEGERTRGPLARRAPCGSHVRTVRSRNREATAAPRGGACGVVPVFPTHEPSTQEPRDTSRGSSTCNGINAGSWLHSPAAAFPSPEDDKPCARVATPARETPSLRSEESDGGAGRSSADAPDQLSPSDQMLND